MSLPSTCIICDCRWSQSEHPPVALKCGHIFGSSCLHLINTEYFSDDHALERIETVSKRTGPECPLCRTEFNLADTTPLFVSSEEIFAKSDTPSKPNIIIGNACDAQEENIRLQARVADLESSIAAKESRMIDLSEKLENLRRVRGHINNPFAAERPANTNASTSRYYCFNCGEYHVRTHITIRRDNNGTTTLVLDDRGNVVSQYTTPSSNATRQWTPSTTPQSNAMVDFINTHRQTIIVEEERMMDYRSPIADIIFRDVMAAMNRHNVHAEDENAPSGSEPTAD